MSLLVLSAGSIAALVALARLTQSWRRQRSTGRHQQLRLIDSLAQLKEIAEDGHLTNDLRHIINAIHVTNQARALPYWPPAINHFERMVSLNLAGNAITYVPAGVGALRQLQSLDLSRNALTNLPPEMCELKSLKTLNLMKNQLTVLPASFGKLRQLKLLGLKSNELVALPDSFSQLESLVELFITDNKLTTLPEGFGALKSLVKLQAAFNAFTHLPPSLFTLPRLEMLRVAVCNIQQWPAPGTLLQSPAQQSPELLNPDSKCTSSRAPVLPRLAWCSLGGNPVAAPVPPAPPGISTIPAHELQLGSHLGDGASGEVVRAQHNGATVAVKLFHADVSPDGRTAEEVGISCQLDHPNLTKVLGLVSEPQGMVLGLVSGRPLAAKPTSAHLLRCKWPEGAAFPLEGVVRVCAGAAAALGFLHARGVAHGDVYAHNLLVDEETWHATLCDFGAAFCYDPAERFWEAMEVRAFGLMMADMVNRIDKPAAQRRRQQQDQQTAQQLDALQRLVTSCLNEAVGARPSFQVIVTELSALMH